MRISVRPRTPPTSCPWRSFWSAAAAGSLSGSFHPLSPPLLQLRKSWRCQLDGRGKPRWYCIGECPRFRCWCRWTTPGSGSRPSRDPRTAHSPPDHRVRHSPSSLPLHRPLRQPPSQNTPPPSKLGSPGCLLCWGPSRILGQNQLNTASYFIIGYFIGFMLKPTCGECSYLSGLSRTGQVTSSVIRDTLVPLSVIHSILLAVLSSRERLIQSVVIWGDLQAKTMGWGNLRNKKAKNSFLRFRRSALHVGSGRFGS